MKAANARSSIRDNRRGMSETLRSMDPRLCFVLGLIACAVVAYYTPLVLIALTGIWVNNLTMMLQMVICVVVLVIQNLIGNRLNKILLTNVVVAVAIGCYEINFIARTSHWSAWYSWWPIFFFPAAVCLFNAWLFLKFKAAAGLDQ